LATPTTTSRAPFVILVQGGIAAGKSTITKLLTELGARHLDCDRLAHEELLDPAVEAAVRERFGDSVFGEDGRVDRKALGSIVFADDEALEALEALLHPRVRDRVQAMLRAARTTGEEPRQVIVIDAAVAPKMRLTERYDLTVFVSASAETRRQRALGRGWPPGELERREAAQAPLREKEQAADVIVPNNGDLAEAKSHVERFWSESVHPQR
jgi:dephospho-CoA kinase